MWEMLKNLDFKSERRVGYWKIRILYIYMCILNIVISVYFDSINKIEDMITYVNKLGNLAMAITDHECLSSHVKFLNTVEKLKSKD